MPDQTITVTLSREEAERVESILNGQHGHTPRTPEKGFPPCLACEVREKLRAALDNSQPEHCDGERERLVTVARAAEMLLDAAERIDLAWPTQQPRDELRGMSFDLAKRGLRDALAALDSPAQPQPESYTRKAVEERLLSVESIHVLYEHCPTITSDDDAGPTEAEEHDLRAMLRATLSAAFPDQQGGSDA